MTHLLSQRFRLRLYLRMVVGSGMLGIAFGYYLQLAGRLEMTIPMAMALSVRGMIVGALIWAFELFWVLGPRGRRMTAYAPTTRLCIRILVYLILGEAGYWIGEAIYAPSDIGDLFFTVGGKS